MIQELRGKWRPFSNFWSCFIEYEGVVYPSVENAYQAAKMRHIEHRQLFFHCKASEAKELGRTYPMREDWNNVKVQIMYELVKQKFSKDEYLRNLLCVASGTQEIQEGNWWGDKFWGTVNGIGENHLGKILMQVRDELRAEKSKELA